MFVTLKKLTKLDAEDNYNAAEDSCDTSVCESQVWFLQSFTPGLRLTGAGFDSSKEEKIIWILHETCFIVV